MSGLYFSHALVELTPGAGHGSSRGATEPYLLHQLIADLFGHYEERPFLYRAEPDRPGVRNVLVLSEQSPLTPQEAPEREFGRTRSLRTKPFEIDVPPGTRLDFEIRLNATKDVPQSGEQRSKRYDIWDAAWKEDPDTSATPRDLYRQYLERKLDGAAVVIDSGLVSREGVKARRGLGRGRPITFVAATLIGTLDVTDAARLEEVVAAGIGRSKAFGCGLMSLSRTGTVLPRRYPDMSLTD